jgi:hypothetical protein
LVIASGIAPITIQISFHIYFIYYQQGIMRLYLFNLPGAAVFKKRGKDAKEAASFVHALSSGTRVLPVGYP